MLHIAFRRAVATTRGRLVLLLAALVAIWLGSAAIAHFVLGEFESFGEAQWSALKHLLDPSQLQEDEDTRTRLIGLFQVICGLIFLVGLAFTIVAEGVSSQIERLGRTNVPVRMSDHLVIVGWLPFVAELLRTLAEATREYAPLGGVAVLAQPGQPDERAAMLAELRAAAGGLAVELIVDDTSSPAAFDLAGVRRARTVVVLSPEQSAHAEVADLGVIQSTLALRGYLQDGDGPDPPVYPLFRRGHDVDAVVSLLPPSFDPLVGDRAMAATIVLALTQHRFAAGLGAHGDQYPPVFPIPGDGLAGTAFGELAGRFAESLPLGVLEAGRGVEGAEYAPAPDRVLREGERVIVLAPDRGAAERLVDGAAPPPPAPVTAGVSTGRPQALRVLIVGWSANARAVIEELHQRPRLKVTVTLLVASEHAEEARETAELFEGAPMTVLVGTTSEPAVLARALERARPDAVHVSSSVTSGQDLRGADAQALLSAFHVGRGAPPGVPVVLELFFPLDAAHEVGSNVRVLSSMVLLAGTIALVVTRPDIGVVLQGLLDGETTDLETVRFSPPDERAVTFGALYQGMLRQGAVPLGVCGPDGDPVMAPRPDAPVRPGDELLVARRLAQR